MKILTTDKSISDMTVAMDEFIEDVVLNLINENDGCFNLRTKSGRRNALSYAITHYEVIGIRLDEDDLEKALMARLKVRGD